MLRSKIFKFSLFLCFIVLSLSLSAQKLYYFSGSDWCSPCIQFKRSFIDSEEFKNFLTQSRVDFEILDFPQRDKKLSKGYKTKRDSLAELYNKEGSFPKLVVVSDSGFLRFDHHQTKEGLIKELEKYFGKKSAHYKSTRFMMGSEFQLTINDIEDSVDCFQKSWSFIQATQNLISAWDTASITSLLNRNAGRQKVKVPYEYFQLVKQCVEISDLTQGAFDVSIRPALEIWDWKKAEVPSKQKIDSVLSLVNYKNIELNIEDTTIFLKRKGMKLDFGAVGKGYVADRLKYFWVDSLDLKMGAINAGGDLVFLGDKRRGVTVPNPHKSNEGLFTFDLEINSIVTSGDYVRNFEKEGRRYSHIIDPKTCVPIDNGITSVTILGSSGTLNDILATAVAVLGEDVGLNLIEQIPGVEIVLVRSDGKEVFSSGVKFDSVKY